MITDRRSLLSAAVAAAASAPAAFAMVGSKAEPSEAIRRKPTRDVFLANDSAFQTPDEFATRLSALVARQANAQDLYLEGGAVRQLENAFAKMLGKEDCVFLPTGTLANHLAVKTLCGSKPRALCLYDSHIFRDERDSLPTLGEIALVPFEKGAIAPSAAGLDEAFDIALNGPRRVEVGAITLESPIRRLDGQLIPFADVERIADKARAHGAKLHLDGARLLLAPPDLDIAGYVAPFDTVYVSLYKYLDAPFGAVLAADKETISTVRNQSGIYGSQIFQGWVAALPALASLETFRTEYNAAWVKGRQFLDGLSSRGFRFKKPIGSIATNVHDLVIDQDRAKAIVAKGAEAEVYMRDWQDGTLRLQINTSILNRPTDELLAVFQSE